MNYFLSFIQEHKFAYIVAISLISTVLIVNSTIEFTERIINNPLLLTLSLAVFYFLFWSAIKIETERK